MGPLLTRRRFLTGGALGAAGAALAGGWPAEAAEPVGRHTPPRLRLGCCAYSYRKHLTGKDRSLTLETFIDLCAGLGLDGVELTSYYFDEATSAYDHRLRRRCFLAGLDVSGAAVGNNFAVPPGPERDKQLAEVSRWVDRAVELGGPCLRVFGGAVPKDTPREQAVRWAAEALQQAAVHAGERGITLALENHGGVTETPEGVLAILGQVESKWVGANLDTGNFHGADPYEDVARLAPYAVNVHLKASVQPRGQPPQPADFVRLAQILRVARYSGYLSLEYEAAEDPMTAVPRIIAEVRSALDRVAAAGAAVAPPGGKP